MAKKYDHVRRKAIELRQQKKTLDEIVEMLKVPRTTVYSWIREVDVEIGTGYRTESARRASEVNQANAAAKRQAAYDEGMTQAPQLFENPLFRDFVNMYIGEGTKKDRNKVEVANSNASVIMLANYWITYFSTNTISYWVQIHTDHDEDEIKVYWSDILNVTPDEIKIKRKSNSGKLSGRQFRSECGVLSIDVGDTYLRSKLQAWMDYLTAQWDVLRTEI